MSEAANVFFEPTFNRTIKVWSRDEQLTSDAGVFLSREADHRLGLTSSLCEKLVDPRDASAIRYTLIELIRERLYAFVQGYGAADDCDRIAHDCAFRLATWDRRGGRPLEERLASQPTQSRLLRILGRAENRQALGDALADWTERHLVASGDDLPVDQGTIDVDGLPIEVHGTQGGAAYHGYYKKTIYSPLVASFAPNGDYDSTRLGDGFVGGMLRCGNASAYEGALELMRRVYKSCESRARKIDFRLDAGFTVASVLDGLTDDGILFLGRLRSNPVLDRLAEPHVVRPVGRPPREGYEYTVELGTHQAKSWKHGQRVVLCVVDAPDPTTGQLGLFPRSFYLVTSWTEEEMTGEELLQHYRGRGTFEDRIGEFVGAIRPRLSSPKFEENEATFLLSLLAFNIANILRTEMEAAAPRGWDLHRLQTTVLKAGARVTTSSRRHFFDVTAAVLPLWKRLCERLLQWRLPVRFPHPKTNDRQRPWTPPPPHAHTTLVLRS